MNKNIKKQKNIIIIGAARSGTSMLANIVRQLIPEKVIYLAEINEIWKNPFKNKKYDAISKELINHKAVKKIKRKIKEISKVKKPGNKTKNILLEKTAANCLRLPLVKKVFPDANFIHILRDGRDVAISAKKKCLGDPRKITKHKNNPKKNISKKFLYLIKAIIHKIKSGIDIKDIISNFQRYLTRILSLLGIKNEAVWGPRFPGIEKIFKKYSLLEACAIQWKVSIDNIIKFKENNKNIKILEIKYENLINSPKKNIQKIINYLNLDNNISKQKIDQICKSIIKNKKNWKDVLTTEEKIKVSKFLKPILKKLEY